MRATAHVTAFPGLVSAPRAGPSRRGPVRVTASREPQNSATSMGLALSGSVMSLNGGLAKFAVRDDVSVSRTEESGKTTVTIKVGTRNITDTNVAGGYLLPTVGPLADPAEAAAKAAALEEQLRLAKLEAEEAARRAKQLEVARTSGSGDFGTRVALSPEALAKLAAEGGMTWAKDVDGLDASYSFYNIYRHGEPLEAVQSTADAAFSALAAWLKEQQAIVEQNFFIERDRLQRIAAADKAAALEAQREELERVFQARLQVEVEKMRIQMEVEKQQALDKLRTEAALAQAQALARLEEQLNSRHAAELEALTARYEAQLDGLRAQMAALQERHAAELESQRAAAAADKKAALERQKREYLSKYRLIRKQLADALELSIDGALTRIGQISAELEEYADAAERQEIM